jgi:hypothetical protein
LIYASAIQPFGKLANRCCEKFVAGGIPGIFENYEVSTDNGAGWTKITKGVPKQGEWIRNP